ncbi:MAG: helix-turn-helix domain-containing protein [Acidimicrobiales bacterium]
MSVLERETAPAGPILSTGEVATRYGVSVKTVVGWVRNGEMTAERVPNAGGRPALLRFDLAEVERFRRERQASQEAQRAEAERKEAERAERSRLWHEARARSAQRRSWSERHREQLEATGAVCQEGRLTRFPIEPLFALAHSDPILRLARTMHVNAGQLHRARRDGLTWVHADRWAVALGFHPAEVWGQAWWSLD